MDRFKDLFRQGGLTLLLTLALVAGTASFLTTCALAQDAPATLPAGFDAAQDLPTGSHDRATIHNDLMPDGDRADIGDNAGDETVINPDPHAANEVTMPRRDLLPAVWHPGGTPDYWLAYQPGAPPGTLQGAHQDNAAA